MSQASRRRFHLALAAAVATSLGFGAVQALATPASGQASERFCPITEPACYCNGVVTCPVPPKGCPVCYEG